MTPKCPHCKTDGEYYMGYNPNLKGFAWVKKYYCSVCDVCFEKLMSHEDVQENSHPQVLPNNSNS